MQILIVVTLALSLSTASSFNLTESERGPKGRILNGENAKLYQFPYMVSLVMKHTDSKYSYCGGSLINNEYVLTAAHCLQDIVEVVVYMGGALRTYGDEKYIVKPKDTILHKSFDVKKKDNDIALVKIPFTKFTDHIKAIKLPNEKESIHVGENTLIAGWGDTVVKKAPVDFLQWASMKVISNAECGKDLNDKVSSFKICAKGEPNVKTCHGDSGGPLILKSEKPVLIGVSILTACEAGHPSIFLRVSSFLNWININASSKSKI